MIAMATALLLLQAAPVEPPLTTDTKPAPFPDVFEEADRVNSPASREALATFAQCVLDRSAAIARRVLASDFTSARYRNGLTRLTRDNADCGRKTGVSYLTGTGLAFAASLAEQLIERDPVPLNARLARAAAGKAAQTYSPSDAVAMCVARSAPDQAARLFASELGSEAEVAAAAALAPAVTACARAVGSPPLEADAFGLRSIVATAAFRLLAAQES